MSLRLSFMIHAAGGKHPCLMVRDGLLRMLAAPLIGHDHASQFDPDRAAWIHIGSRGSRGSVSDQDALDGILFMIERSKKFEGVQGLAPPLKVRLRTVLCEVKVLSAIPYKKLGSGKMTYIDRQST